MKTNHLVLDTYQQFVRQTNIDTHNAVIEVDAIRPVFELVGEVGEVVELFQKSLRQGAVMPTRERILDELGDVQWGLTSLANHFGISLTEMLEKNEAKLRERLAARDK